MLLEACEKKTLCVTDHVRYLNIRFFFICGRQTVKKKFLVANKNNNSQYTN